jgi:WD40 repeat protein
MKNTYLLLSLITLLIAGCASPAAVPQASQPNTPIPNSSPTTETNVQIKPSATIAPTQTQSPSPTSIPSPTATPPPGISKVNFSEFAVTTQYLPGLRKVVKDLKDDFVFNGLDISPNGRYIAVGGCTQGFAFNCPNDVFGSHAFLVILDAATAEPISVLPEKETTITGVQFSPDSSQLVYAAYPQRVVIWNIADNKIENTYINNDHPHTKLKMRVNPDGKSIAASTVGSLRIIDYESGVVLKELTSSGFVPRYNASGSRLAMNTSDDGSEITVFDTATWVEISRFQIPDTSTTGYSMDFSPDGKWIVTVPLSDSPVIRVWDAGTGQPVKTLDETAGKILSVEFSPDSQMLFISIYTDLEVIDKISAWDVNTWQKLGVLTNYSENSNLSFNSTGEFMLAANGKDIWRWSRMDAQTVKSREIVKDFFAALGKGDYTAAAVLYQPDKYEIDNLKSIGLDTSDLVNLLEQVCAGKTRICLPVKNILPGGGLSQFDQYEVHVQFQAEDGTTYTGTYGSDLYTFVGLDANQQMKVNFIPYRE